MRVVQCSGCAGPKQHGLVHTATVHGLDQVVQVDKGRVLSQEALWSLLGRQGGVGIRGQHVPQDGQVEGVWGHGAPVGMVVVVVDVRAVLLARPVGDQIKL